MFWSIVSSMPHKQPRHSRHRRPLNKRASALQGAASRPTLPDPGEAGMPTGSDGSYHDPAFRHPFRVTADQQLMVDWLADFQQGASASSLRYHIACSSLRSVLQYRRRSPHLTIELKVTIAEPVTSL